MKRRLNDEGEKAHDDQHLHGWERHLAATADVVAHEIAGTRQQLKERIDKGTGVHAPKECYIFFDGAPSHTSHLSTLSTARTVVVGKLGSAVVASLYGVSVAVDIMRLRPLLLVESLVFLY